MFLIIYGGYEIDAKIRRVASGLNITHLLESQWKDLSGGERTKVAFHCDSSK
jgi:ATP-binding cassette subfamily F protein 3